MKMFKTNYNRVENKSFAITVAESIVEELNSCGNYNYDDVHEYVWNDLEARMIYNEDRWKLMSLYQNPDEANYNKAFMECYSEICSIIEEVEETEESESNNIKKEEIKMKAKIKKQSNTNKTERYDTCCFCGAKMLPEESHNPYPVKPYSLFTTEIVEGRCCSMCNQSIVQPARIEKLRRGEF